jgi:hypothetical protein
MLHYRVFGLTFRSNCELPGLDRIAETPVVDYSLRFDEGPRFELLRRDFHLPWYVSPGRLQCGRIVLQAWKAEYCRKFLFRFYDSVEIIIDQERGDIWVNPVGRASLQAATHHLLFSLPGFLLSLRRSACLHGAAIGWGDGAIALLGPSYSGKSVLSAQLATQGIEVLSDDLVAMDVVDGTVNVYPGYPWICLRPATLLWLRSDKSEMGRLHSEWQYLDEAYVTWDLRGIAAPFQAKPRELEAIYLLAPVTDSNCEPDILPIPWHRTLMASMQAATRTHIPYPEFLAQEFLLLGEIVAAIPTYELRYHLSAESLKAISRLLVHTPRERHRRREAAEA